MKVYFVFVFLFCIFEIIYCLKKSDEIENVEDSKKYSNENSLMFDENLENNEDEENQMHQELYLGAIFENVDKNKEILFELTTDSINNNQMLPGFELKTRIESIPQNNMFAVSETVCKLLNNEIIGVFGPSFQNSFDYVHSFCENMDLPLILMSDQIKSERGKFINLYPHVLYLQKMFVELIKELGWEQFTILYEDSNNLGKIDEFLKIYDSKGPTVTLIQLKLGINNNNYRPILQRLRNSKEKYIVIDCSADILYDVLKQAQEVGILIDDYYYILTSLNSHTINLEEFKSGGANITMARLIDPKNPTVLSIFEKWKEMLESSNRSIDEYDLSPDKILIENALIHDATYIFTEALNILNGNIEPKALDCEGTESWKHGSTLLNFMKNLVFDGLTGHIIFDNEGFRSEFQVDILEITFDGVQKIGFWNSTEGFNIQRNDYGEVEAIEDESDLRNKHFIVLISLTPPYGMAKESIKQLKGNDRYEGFCIELIEILSGMLGFNYTFEVESDYGKEDNITKTWTGMIKRLQEGSAHLAITDLTITSQKAEVVDFSSPFMNLGISILFKKPQKAPPEMFSFKAPFSNNVWICLGCSYIGVSCLLYIFGRLSPAEWTNPFPCINEPTKLYNQFSFANSLWYTTGSILTQGCEIAPIGQSTRLVGAIWYFFVLIMVNTYIANLAACLTVELPVSPFDTVEDLPKQTDIKYGAKEGGSTANFFRDSTHETYQNIWKTMNELNTFPKSNPEGVNLVKTTDFAFFMESTSIEYITQKECDLAQKGSLLDDKGYGIAMQKNAPYRNTISTAILQLQESGRISTLKEKWWKEKGGGGACSEDDEDENLELGLDNVSGVFVVTIVLFVIAFFVAILEMFTFIYKKGKKTKISFLQCGKEEFLFFIQFSKMTREVNKFTDNENDVDENNNEKTIEN